MAKRIADKELTDRNWDQEDESEEAGTFAVASDDVMKNRSIKKAKRRNAGAEGESGGTFKVFKGFSLTPAAGGAVFGNGSGFKPLSSLTNGNAAALAAPSFGGLNSIATTTPSTAAGANGPTSAPPPAADVTDKRANGSSPTLAQSSSGSSKEYSRQLTALNCSVRDWITKHVNDNPLCDLNPIFRDYERHLATIEKKYAGGTATAAAQPEPAEEGKSEESSSTTATGSAAAPSTGNSILTTPAAGGSSAAPALFSFGRDKDGTGAPPSTGPPSTAPPAAAPPAVTFNFGQKLDSSVLSSLGQGGAPSFSFSSSTSSSSSSTSLFGVSTSSTGAAATFSFSQGLKPEAGSNSQSTGEDAAEEESDEPPVPEVREIVEKDAFYSKKCKLFYKKDNEFKEKGVGMLHLKMASEGKLQLLVRADTNLGNILLNILVPETMPCSRTGKNNVLVVCVPNPPVDTKSPSSPVPILIRVKTTEDADELHKVLQEKKA